MAWSTPSAFVAGSTLTAAQLNVLVADLVALGAPWSTWVPTFTNLSVGNGSYDARYRQAGKTVDFLFAMTAGSTTGGGSQWGFTLPATPWSSLRIPFQVSLYDASASNTYIAQAIWRSGSSDIGLLTMPGTAGNALVPVTATTPFTVASGDFLTVAGTYEVA